MWTTGPGLQDQVSPGAKQQTDPSTGASALNLVLQAVCVAPEPATVSISNKFSICPSGAPVDTT